jgi:pimeloyl-ACP methyl ester carboxylesterase
MNLWRRLLIALVVILFVATVMLVAGSLTSYDYERKHTRESDALPAQGSTTSGLLRIAVGDQTFRARAVALDGAATPVLMLHGFPETSAMWTPLLDAFATAGRPAVAFDQRGYSAGARPAGVDAYRTPALVGDALSVADALGWKRFHLIGHDWGAAVGWMTTLAAPERVVSWTALSIPHPVAFGRALTEDADQQARSRYFYLFRTPWLPELLFSFNGFRLLESMYGPMSPAQKREYLAVFSEPGALAAALNWYRAMDGAPAIAGASSAAVSQPVLFAWGNRDPAVSRAAVDGQRALLVGTFEEVELDAGHWLMEEVSDALVPRIVAFIGTVDAGATPRVATTRS